jgi:hypothetical protein
MTNQYANYAIVAKSAAAQRRKKLKPLHQK